MLGLAQLAFSTSWNSHRHTAGDVMLREIKALGFDLIELGQRIPDSLLSGIQRMFEAGEARCSSLHIACSHSSEVNAPIASGFASAEASERETAVCEALRMIDRAQRFGARAVILHCGMVAMTPITRELVALAQEGKLLSRSYVRKKIAAVRQREEGGSILLDRMEECLRPIIALAVEKNIALGIAAARGYEQIPSERELRQLCARLPHLGYWHHMGHIQIKENLGFLDHVEWLRAIARRTVGCQMQDVKWPAEEGQLPFSGEMAKLETLIGLLPSTSQIVWEVNPANTAEEITRARELWQQRFGP